MHVYNTSSVLNLYSTPQCGVLLPWMLTVFWTGGLKLKVKVDPLIFIIHGKLQHEVLKWPVSLFCKKTNYRTIEPTERCKPAYRRTTACEKSTWRCSIRSTRRHSLVWKLNMLLSNRDAVYETHIPKEWCSMAWSWMEELGLQTLKDAQFYCHSLLRNTRLKTTMVRK